MTIAVWVQAALAILGWATPDWTGVATFYSAAQHAGRPLYCDQFMAEAEPLIYDEANTPWAAIDVERYTSGDVRCGEWLLLVFDNESWLAVQALDAGKFEGRYVETYGPGTQIAVDLPEHEHPNGGACLVNVYRLEDDQ